MKIRKLKIVNYKLFQNVVIEMNDSMNIFVGENDSGKSTILEALSMVLTGRINGSSIINRLTLDWFNSKTRSEFKKAVESGKVIELPAIEIEAFFAPPDETEVFTRKKLLQSGLIRATLDTS